jgi:hypothetical protein
MGKVDLLVRTVPEKDEAQELVRALSKPDNLCLAPLPLASAAKGSQYLYPMSLGWCGWWRPNTNCGS